MQTLPTDVADLTPSWMSEALGTEVTEVKVLDHAFATNQRARVALTYASDGAGPDTLFVKLAPLDPVHREMIGATGMGEREAQFYADVAPNIDLLVPRSFFGASDDANAFILLLEDLGAAAGVSSRRTANGASRPTPAPSRSSSSPSSTPGSSAPTSATASRPGWARNERA